MTPTFDLQTFSSVTQVGQEAWDRLAQGQPFASYRWYQFGEAVLTGMTPVYIVLSHAGEPVARATFWLSRQETLPVPAPARAVLGGMLRRWPLLICRAPVIDYGGLILPPPPRREEALALIGQAALAVGREQHASFALFDYVDPRDDTLRWPSGFEVFSVADPGMCLDIPWLDFESYLGQLSASMRKDYRRHFNRAQDAEIEIRVQSNVTRLADALPLMHKVERQHGAAAKPYARAILENAHRVPAAWITAEIGDRLVGCGLLLGDGDTYGLTLLGLDYEVRFAYFQLVYAAIRAAIEAGARHLYGGSGAYDLKRRLGFEPQHDNYLALAAHQRVFRQLVQWLN